MTDTLAVPAKTPDPGVFVLPGLEIEAGGKTAQVKREMESGMNEIFRLNLPAVIEIQAGINHPRYASLKGIMGANKKPIEEVTLSTLGLAEDAVGLFGSRLEIVSVAFPESGAGAQILSGDAATAAGALVDKLRQEARVI